MLSENAGSVRSQTIGTNSYLHMALVHFIYTWKWEKNATEESTIIEISRMVYSFRLVNFGWFPKKKVLQNGSIKGMNHWISYVFQVIETIFYIKKKFIIRWDGPKMSRHIYFKIPKRIAASSSSSARKKFPP